MVLGFNLYPVKSESHFTGTTRLFNQRALCLVGSADGTEQKSKKRYLTEYTESGIDIKAAGEKQESPDQKDILKNLKGNSACADIKDGPRWDMQRIKLSRSVL